MDGLHTLVNQPKLVESYEELDKRLQQWYIEATTKRTHSEGSSEGSKKRAKVNMIKTIKNKVKEKFRFEIEEIIQSIEDQGRSQSKRKDQNVRFIDEDQGKLLKLHKGLDTAKSYLNVQSLKILRKKIVVYESYGNSERDLRNKAVETFKRFKTQLLEGENDSSEKNKEEDDEDSKSSQWKTPKVNMMRAIPLEELEDQRLIDIERRG